jgi:putative Holliday junction resolvase
VLGLDYGAVRCGCAISDPTGTIVTPLSALEPDLELVAELVARRSADRVVIGLPVSMDGTEGPQAAVTRDFASALAARLEVPVEAYDERLTTRMAQRSARAGASADEDSLAAAHMLESYLASQGGQATPDAEPGGRRT